MRFCARYHIDLVDMIGDGRNKRLVRIRRIAIYLARRLTGKSLTKIGNAFDRDHTTILTALKRISEARATEPRLDAEFVYLEVQLKAHASVEPLR